MRTSLPARALRSSSAVRIVVDVVDVVAALALIGGALAGCGPAPRDTNEQDGDNTGPAPAAPALTWTDVTGIPDNGTSPYVSATLLDGKLYVLSGDYQLPEDTLHVYDLAADEWTVGPAFPGSGRLAPVALAADGRAWFIGGYEGATAERLPDTYAFDPATQAWTLHAPMQLGRFEHCGAVVGGKLYVFGGHDGRSAFYENSGEVYDIAADTWSPIAPLPHARQGGAAVVVGGRVFLAGGLDNDDYLRIIDVYDPAGDAWTTADFALREPRWSLSAAPLGDHIVVTGGAVYGGPDVGELDSTTVEVIDPAERWSSYADDLGFSIMYGIGIAVDDTSALVVGNNSVRRVSLQQ